MTNPQNRYEIIQTIGTGATSRVDLARDSVIGRTVAIKTFLRGFSSGDLQKQFLREAQIFGRLSHPYIVALYDVGTNDDGVPYLVMEHVEGKTLEAAMSAGKLPLERAAVWGADLASALALAHHSQVIHGDVKPANILITKYGQVKLGDFGIARFATQVSASGAILGTPAYLSPEQILGQKQDSRSDLFSLGIILYQMSTGVRPFDGTSVGAVCAQIVSSEPLPPSHHNPELPPAFDHVVMRCLAKNPASRYATAESLGASLYPFARSKPVDLRLPHPSWWQRPFQISDLRVAAAAILALATFGAGMRAISHHYSSRPATDSSKRQVAPATSPLGSGDTSNANSAVQAAGSLINISSSGDGRFDALRPENSPDALKNPSGDGNSSNLFSSLVGAPAASKQAAPAFERSPVKNAKAKRLHPAGSNAEALTSATTPPPGIRDADGSLADKATNATLAATSAAKASLHVDVVATVTDEILSVYADDQRLLSAPLLAAHLGDTLRFECPIAPGEHAFRVVVTRPDETVLLEKANTTQIRPDASNFLGVHVSRRAKLLLKHETALEVVWPSTAAPLPPVVTVPVVTANVAQPLTTSAVQ
jgi:serine/threonine protein kinase